MRLSHGGRVARQGGCAELLANCRLPERNLLRVFLSLLQPRAPSVCLGVHANHGREHNFPLMWKTKGTTFKQITSEFITPLLQLTKRLSSWPRAACGGWSNKISVAPKIALIGAGGGSDALDTQRLCGYTATCVDVCVQIMAKECKIVEFDFQEFHYVGKIV